MNAPSRPLDAAKSSIKAAITRSDVNELVAQAEGLMRWQQAEDDSEKMEAAALLDDIAAYLMRSKEYAAARMVIMGSLRVKGTLGKESGLTTFSYQQLEECERAVEKEVSIQKPLQNASYWSSNFRALIIASVVAVLAIWGIFVWMFK